MAEGSKVHTFEMTLGKTSCTREEMTTLTSASEKKLGVAPLDAASDADNLNGFSL